MPGRALSSTGTGSRQAGKSVRGNTSEVRRGSRTRTNPWHRTDAVNHYSTIDPGALRPVYSSSTVVDRSTSVLSAEDAGFFMSLISKSEAIARSERALVVAPEPWVIYWKGFTAHRHSQRGERLFTARITDLVVDDPRALVHLVRQALEEDAGSADLGTVQRSINITSCVSRRN